MRRSQKTRKSSKLKDKIKYAKNLIIGTIISKLKNTSIFKKYKEKQKKTKVTSHSYEYKNQLGLSSQNDLIL